MVCPNILVTLSIETPLAMAQGCGNQALIEELATLNRKIQLTIKPAGGHESGTDDGPEMKGEKATGESDDTPDLPRKAGHVPSMEIVAPTNGLKKIS